MLKLAKYLVHKDVSSPVYLIFFVTEKCNASCPHCFVKNTPGGQLSIAEIEKVSKTFSKDLFNVNLTGGEPFLRKDLAEIVGIFRKNSGVRSFLIATNGFFVQETLEAVQKILKENSGIKLTISISLDHIGKKHDQARGIPGLYDNVLRLYRALSAMDEKRLSVQINFTLQHDNYADAEKILQHFACVEGLRNISLTVVRGDPAVKTALDIDCAKYAKVGGILDSYFTQGRLSGFESGYMKLLNAKNQISREVIGRTISQKRFISACYAGKITGVLRANGDVYPCELYKDKIGNIRDTGYDFKALWRSKNAQIIRKEILRNKCFCTHECNWTTNILFNPRYLPEIMIRATISLFGRRRLVSFGNSQVTAAALTVLVCAFNEEVTIGEKIRNTFESDKDNLIKELLVVDDNSTDRTHDIVDGLRNKYSKLKVIKNSRPAGKWGAILTGIENSKAQIICLTDADVLLQEGAITEALKMFDQPGVGAVTSSQKIILSNGKNKGQFKLTIYERLRNYLRIVESKIDSTLSFHGQCMFFRKDALETKGKNLMADDWDIAIRIRRAGYRTVYCPRSFFIERMGGSFDQATQRIFRRRSLAATDVLLENKDLFFNPKYGKFGLICFPLEFLINIVFPFIFNAALAALFLYFVVIFAKYKLPLIIFMILAAMNMHSLKLAWYQMSSVISCLLGRKQISLKWTTPRSPLKQEGGDYLQPIRSNDE